MRKATRSPRSRKAKPQPPASGHAQSRGISIETDLKRSSALTSWLGPLLLAAQFVTMTWWSWRLWPDPLIDFGNELYVAWRLMAGDVLYRDVAYLFGPLSPHINGALFGIFGDSITTLIVANLLILALIVAGIYRLVSRETSRLAATACGAVCIGVFSFSQYTITGNYNFICPYNHGVTHGTALLVGLLLCLQRIARPADRQRSSATGTTSLLAGVCLGGLFLTKPEFALAGFGATAVYFAARWFCFRAMTVADEATVVAEASRSPHSPLWNEGKWLTAGIAAPMLLCILWFTLLAGADQAVSATLGAWLPIFRSGSANQAFYRSGMGLDKPWTNVSQVVSMTALALFFVGVAIKAAQGLARLLARAGEASAEPASPYERWFPAAVASLLTAIAFTLTTRQVSGLNLPQIPWMTLPQSFGPLLLLFAVLHIRALRSWAASGDSAATIDAGRGAFRLAAIAAAGLLLLKIILHVRVSHYGFCLAMPAAIVITAVLLGELPDLQSLSAAASRMLRGMLLGGILAVILVHIQFSNLYYKQKTMTVGSGGDVLYAMPAQRAQQLQVYPRGVCTAEAVRWMREYAEPDATLMVLPEGAMINYQLRRRNPTPYHNLAPIEVATYGESNILTAIKQSPPDYIVLVYKSAAEYGQGMFGSPGNYGESILAWVEEHYSVAVKGGGHPLQSKKPGLWILERKRVNQP